MYRHVLKISIISSFSSTICRSLHSSWSIRRWKWRRREGPFSRGALVRHHGLVGGRLFGGGRLLERWHLSSDIIGIYHLISNTCSWSKFFPDCFQPNAVVLWSVTLLMKSTQRLHPAKYLCWWGHLWILQFRCGRALKVILTLIFSKR